MRSSNQRAEIRTLPTGGRVRDLPLDAEVWKQAHDAFLAEDYDSALTQIRHALNTVPSMEGLPVVPVPEPGTATVKDGVVLCARCLFQLDRYQEFEVLQASAGRWGLVPERMPDLDVVNLEFACKHGSYSRVICEATTFIGPIATICLRSLRITCTCAGLPIRTWGNRGAPARTSRPRTPCSRSSAKIWTAPAPPTCWGLCNCGRAISMRRGNGSSGPWRATRRLRMLKNMGGNRLNLGIVAYKLGDLGQALVEFEAARGLLESINAQVSLCRLDIARGNTLRLLRDFNGAKEHLLNAFEAAGQLQLSREEALALEFLGDVARDENRLDGARRYYSRALAIAGAIAPEGDVVMEVMRRQGEALVLLNRPAEAVGVLQRALSLAVKQKDRFEEGVICRVLATALLDLSDLASAGGQIRKAVDILRDLGAGHELMQALMQAAAVSLARAESGLDPDPVGQLEAAWQDAMGALDLALKTEVDHWIISGRKLLNEISSRRQLREQEVGPVAVVGAPARPDSRIVHVSSSMRDVIQLADAFAESREPVLITGETGTGKELFARRLHMRSPRRGKNLVCVNVSAIAESVFAREFFGHVRGAYTGADTDGAGLAGHADGGTLFLDEIGDLPLDLQPRLLRLLQEGTYQAVGDPRERRTDVRLVAATNADLKQLVAEGRFRADLYYRLKILELKIPPLRQRRDDVLHLLRHFLSEAEGHLVEMSAYFNAASLDRIQCYYWPGNVREVAMVARQARVQLASRGSVCVELEDTDGHPIFLTGPEDTPAGRHALAQQSVGSVVPGIMGRSRILLALTEASGNRAEAARRLGVSRSTLYRRMEKLGIAAKVITN